MRNSVLFFILFFHYSFKGESVVEGLTSVLDDINKLPIPNKLLMVEILKLAKAVHDDGSSNKWTDIGALASMIDPCLTVAQDLTYDESKNMANNNFPMLSYLIQNFGENKEVSFDGKNFQQRA